MSTLTELLRQVGQQDAQLAADIAREVKALQSRRAFGLNFERHKPETVDLPGRPIRKGDKVRFLAARGEPDNSVDQRLWLVQSFSTKVGIKSAKLTRKDNPEADTETAERAVEDLVVVAEFRDPIYPGLVSTGKVERGGDKPFHTVINAENFHALQALLYTHEGKVDAIYIDPPYNTGAKDWKYNNDYVDGEDQYRHSKWLAFMERRLKLAKRLLKPESSVLIVTIDEKEYLRLGLLLEQTFPESRVQMVSATVSPRSTSRNNEFSRVDEYLYFVFFGDAGPSQVVRDTTEHEIRWLYLRRTQRTLVRGSRPNQFYPVYVDERSLRIVDVGAPLSLEDDLNEVPTVKGAVPVFPINPDGEQLIWGLTGPKLKEIADAGYVRVTEGNEQQPYTIAYLSTSNIKKVEAGEYQVAGVRPDGSKIVVSADGRSERPTTVWRETSHDAGAYGTTLLRSLIPGRRFPFPKSLYAVEDTLRVALGPKKESLVLDFFSGSGTTAHAVMRLNKQDGGRRQCISVTNNEVGAEEQEILRKKKLRQGDPEWEALGICDYVTKPRIKSAITGKTPDGKEIAGGYKFRDEFPICEGFSENAEFFSITYEAPRPVAHHRSFSAVAPLLWLRAGASGRRIEKESGSYDLADTYGVLFDLDTADDFLKEISDSEAVRIAYIVTDDDRSFQAICSELPAHVEGVRLYESYLTNFTINTGRD